jgi:Rieske 2Fe-2S family protein
VSADSARAAGPSPLERTLHRDYYFSPEIFGLEKERIFAHEWFCVGREEAIPERGDYLRVDVVGESVLIVRTATGALAGHYNVCRHRGCRLSLGECAPSDSPSPSGSFGQAIRCPYHSWTYALDGALRHAPFLDDEVEFDRNDYHLFPMGVECWGGFIFVNLQPAAATAAGRSLMGQLGAAPERLVRYPLAELRTARRLVYEVRANWKVVLENYNECYHCAGVHPELCTLVPAFKYRGGSELDWDRGIPHRDGAWTFTASGTTTRAPFPGLNEDELVRHKGELIYPNVMLSVSAEHAACFHLFPRDAEHTTIVCDFLFHPTEMAKRDFDPSDAVEFWDVVNRQDWTICEGVQDGMRSRVFTHGLYAPMESWSLDIRRYVGERLGMPLDPHSSKGAR